MNCKWRQNWFFHEGERKEVDLTSTKRTEFTIYKQLQNSSEKMNMARRRQATSIPPKQIFFSEK